MQGVIRTYDPQTREGVLVRDDDHTDLPLSIDALEGSVFRMLRQGQRVIFDVDDAVRFHPTSVGPYSRVRTAMRFAASVWATC